MGDNTWCRSCASYGCTGQHDMISVPAPLLAAALTTKPDQEAQNDLTELLRKHYIGHEDDRWKPVEAISGTSNNPSL